MTVTLRNLGDLEPNVLLLCLIVTRRYIGGPSGNQCAPPGGGGKGTVAGPWVLLRLPGCPS